MNGLQAGAHEVHTVHMHACLHVETHASHKVEQQDNDACQRIPASPVLDLKGRVAFGQQHSLLGKGLLRIRRILVQHVTKCERCKHDNYLIYVAIPNLLMQFGWIS
jgi:hypothetical protein